MRPFFDFIKKYLKIILTLSLVLFILVFITLFLFEQHRQNTILEERLNRLETLKVQSVVTPDQLYAQSRNNIKDKEYDAALNNLMQLKSNYPYWHPKMVDKSIEAVKNIKGKINKTQSELEQQLDQLAATGENNINYDSTNYQSETVSRAKNYEFKKFEYQDTKFPLKTSNTGHSKNISSMNRRIGMTKNADGSITGSSNDFAFQKFEFEDSRYKKRIKAVPSSKTNSEITTKISRDKNQEFEKHEFEDNRYKKRIVPSKRKTTIGSSDSQSTAKDTSKLKKNYNYEDPRYKK